MALTGACAGAAAAQEQRGPCFDVVAGPAETRPIGAILLNRCSGQTWILVRTYRPAAKGNPGQYVYQWSALASEGPEARLREPTPAPAAGGDKCFVFQGRRFCE